MINLLSDEIISGDKLYPHLEPAELQTFEELRLEELEIVRDLRALFELLSKRITHPAKNFPPDLLKATPDYSEAEHQAMLVMNREEFIRWGQLEKRRYQAMRELVKFIERLASP
jgi:hypothetical protein